MTFARNNIVYVENSFCLVTPECVNIYHLHTTQGWSCFIICLAFTLRISNFFLATFLFFIKFQPIRSCIFSFLLNAIVGLSTNTLWNSGLICKMCHFFRATSMFGSVNKSLIFFLLLLHNFVTITSTFLICLFKLPSLYFYFITAQFLWYSSSVEHIVFDLNVWLYVILFFNALRCSDLG